MASIDISVVIPTFNRCSRLREAMLSVINQERSVGEIIVVDDGSTDNTRQEVLRLADQAPVVIRYIRQSNRGPAAARNVGIREALGEILAFLDSDDTWHPKKIALHYESFRCSEAYLISHTRETWLRNGEHLNPKKKHLAQPGDIFNHCLRLCCVGMSTVLARKQLFSTFGLFDESLRCCEDYDLWLRVAAREKFHLIETPLTIKHGGRTDQVSSLYRQGMDRFRIQALAKLIVSGALTGKQREAALGELTLKCLVYGNGCLKHGRRAEAEHYLGLSRQVAAAAGK